MVNKEYVIVLGNFDGVHKGHQYLIERANEYAKNTGLTLSALTFGYNVDALLGFNSGLIITNENKIQSLKKLGVQKIITIKKSKKFLQKSPTSFLDWLNKKLKIKAYFVGSDYTFGNKKSGNVSLLKEYAEKLNQQVFVNDFVLYNNEKVSSTTIKQSLVNGNIFLANELLGYNYYVSGRVVKGRSVGKKIGYPTINIRTIKGLVPLKKGVYKGLVNVQGVNYNAVINYGSRPTFNNTKTIIEAHLINYSGNLYGKKLKIQFIEYLREIQKFESASDLANQIKNDVLRCTSK